MTALKEFVVVPRGSVDPTCLDGDTPCVLMEHIESRTGVSAASRLGELDLRSTKKEFEENDLLVGKLRPALRKVSVMSFAGICSSDIAVLRPTVPYVYLLASVLRSDLVSHQFESMTSGASLPRVNVKDMLSVDIPWPDRDEDADRLNEVARHIIEGRVLARETMDRLMDVETAITNELV